MREVTALIENDDRSVYKKQDRQLLAKVFGHSGWKIRPLLNLTYWRHLGGWKFCYFVATCLGKVLICRELERISGEKQISEVWPLFCPFCTKWPKFGRRCVRLLFLFGSFWVMRPNNWPVGNNDKKLCKSRKAFQPIAVRETVPICPPRIRNFRRWHCCINENLFVAENVIK